MRREIPWLIFLVLLLLISSLACETLAGSQPSPTTPPQSASEVVSPPTESGSGAAVPGIEESGGEDPQRLTVRSFNEGLTKLNSYRLQLQMTFAPADGSGEQTISAEILFMREPPASSMTFNFDGVQDMPEGSNVTFVQVENTAYANMPGLGCVSGSSQEMQSLDDPFTDLTDPGTFLGQVSGAERVLPDEVINGVRARHYVFNETALQSTNQGLQTVDGHVYVAIEGNYVVRVDMTGEGQTTFMNNQVQSGAFHLVFDLFAVNQPIEITRPPGCDAAATEYPMLEDASEVASFQGLVTYKTKHSFEEVVTFYQEEMVKAGWTASEEPLILEGTAIFNYVKDGANLTVTINQDGGEIVVLLTSQ